MKNKMHHYHLVACEVAFFEPSNEQIGVIKMNVLLRTDEKNFKSADIGKSQQVAQLQFFEKLQDQTLEVKDVFLFAVSYLGHMTEEHFTKLPEGMAKQERVTAPPTTAFDS